MEKIGNEIRTEPISMVPDIAYFDRSNLIRIVDADGESEDSEEEITVE